ncbi:hypothetical protein [Maritimibacter sp. HL-12]|jgi:hypothetical protein|uniref:hypothetical protein n=1 Tax=Maritimibacter sp. HL-12 TaxID=1162418 RepID=UPI000A0F2124|nr:hypothetical protein [Maritimibacter sp. HL-12]SMH57625.1 hypothetical protein SAMN05661107_3455 [Maritimibacter sp. HL-12]
MSGDFFVAALTEHGPWVLLVFYLLWRDLQKDQATRAVLDKNSAILIEITTIIRERLPQAGRPGL